MIISKLSIFTIIYISISIDIVLNSQKMTFMEKCFMCYLLLWTVDIQNVHVNDVSMYFAKPYLEKLFNFYQLTVNFGIKFLNFVKFWHESVK